MLFPLVLAAEPAHLKVQYVNGYAFVEGMRGIGDYLGNVHGIGLPH